MLIQSPKGWTIPEREATPESVFLNRRKLLHGMGFLGMEALTRQAFAAGAELYPAKRNAKYTLDRPLTAEPVAIGYNNFYEFTLDKQRVKNMVDAFSIEPWTVKVHGLINNPKTYDIDDLVRAFPLEERLYRFRCVETWAMAVPWTGFQISHLIQAADPKPEAKYIRMVTAMQREAMPGVVSQPHYPWPYYEGLEIKEAMNELALFVTGIYGKPLPKQNGAPIRLMVPWKYGLKSIKSIVEIEFTEKRPPTLWNKVGPTEYGRDSNVDPKKPHPRRPQAHRPPDSHRRGAAHADVQRLRGVCCGPLHGQGILGLDG